MNRLRHIVYLIIAFGAMWACLPEPLPVENVPDIKPTVVVGSQELPTILLPFHYPEVLERSMQDQIQI